MIDPWDLILSVLAAYLILAASISLIIYLAG